MTIRTKSILFTLLGVLLPATAVTTNNLRREQDESHRSLGILPIAIGEDNNIVPLSNYARVAVCVDTTYVNPDVDPCTADELIQFTNDANPTGRQFRYQDQGPTTLQGVFWLHNPYDNIMSFAATPDVGGGISTGTLERDHRGYHYRLRVRGDRTWGFHAADNFDLSGSYDPILLFRVIEGTLEAPLKFSIYALRSYFGFDPRVYYDMLFRIINYNTMELVTDPNDPSKEAFPGSAVWRRKSYVFFFRVFSYDAIQIVDGSGAPIEPAYSAWVLSQQTDEAAGSPNWNYFDYLV